MEKKDPERYCENLLKIIMWDDDDDNDDDDEGEEKGKFLKCK